MAKLKVNRIIKMICQTCKGNGYVKVPDAEDIREMNVHQCWDCDSEGEFYETNDNLIDDGDSDDYTSNKLH
jgi:hypothetical protein